MALCGIGKTLKNTVFRRFTERHFAWKKRTSALKVDVGKTGEALAAAYLKKQGYRILARNFRDKLGEIDIIAKEKNVVCFVEVRTRQKARSHEDALASVDIFKQKKLSRLAMDFLKKNNFTDGKARFDVVAVSLKDQEKPILLIKNAFPVIGRYA
jgi:putative endonuclease